MKRTCAVLSFLFLAALNLQLSAQNKLFGNWEGILSAGQQKFRLIIHVSQDSSGVKTTLDSPQQNAFKIPMESTAVSGDTIIIKDKKSGIIITGLYRSASDSIYSNFAQSGARFSMKWGRTSATGIFNRPQTPKAPFPYKSEEVTFANPRAGNIKLSGTLTLPPNVKNPPAVILISGSGPQDRNEQIFAHEPFLVLSDYLSRNGIAVLRYDDRGIGKSEGIFDWSTTYDFSSDAMAAVEYLKGRSDIDTKKIGLIGHSEGGLIAPMLASKDKSVAFIILLAAPGVSIDKLMLRQARDIAEIRNAPQIEIDKIQETNGAVFDLIRNSPENSPLDSAVVGLLKKHNYAGGNEVACRNFAQTILSPWYRNFIRMTPQEYLEKVKCPVLAINGDLDKQVNARMNLDAIRSALNKSGNKDVTIQTMNGMNHLFQEAKTGADTEYVQIEQTMSPLVLDMISKWIHDRF